MFWRKKKKIKKISAKNLKVRTIPNIFYGGNDPLIYHTPKSVTPTKQRGILQKTAKKEKKELRGIESGQRFSFLKSRKTIISLFVVFFVLALSAISWYYMRDYFAAQRLVKQRQEGTVQIEEVEKIEQPEIVEEPEIELEPVGVLEVVTSTVTTTEFVEPITTTELETIVQPPIIGKNVITFPVISLLDTPDIDSDQLTDAEEEIFDTDSGGFDTDKDGYYDGQEVLNLYNPKGVAPIKIIDSGFVKEYLNSSKSYRLYHPTSWQVGSVDIQGDQVLFSSIKGDYVEVRVVEKRSDENFQQWFDRVATAQKYGDLLQFVNRFDVEGMKRRDGLVAYFDRFDSVVVMVYHVNTPGPIAYRNIMQLMMQSFRHSGSSSIIPEQEIIPETETTTTNPATT